MPLARKSISFEGVYMNVNYSYVIYISEQAVIGLTREGGGGYQNP